MRRLVSPVPVCPSTPLSIHSYTNYWFFETENQDVLEQSKKARRLFVPQLRYLLQKRCKASIALAFCLMRGEYILIRHHFLHILIRKSREDLAHTNCN